MVESNPWDEFIRRAKAIVDSGNLDSGEVDYKVDISKKLGVAREAVLEGTDGWHELLRSGLTGRYHPLPWQVADRLRAWINESPDHALKTMQAFWAEDNLSVIDRVRPFSSALPQRVASRPGVFTNLVSVLLMGLDVEQYPPYRTGVFKKAYESTGYNMPEQNADEAALYVHALGFLDQFIEEASKRELTLRHRLDAQSVLWYSQDEETLPPVPPPLPSRLDLDELAEQLFLPVAFLEEIETLLNDKRKPQVIFQGPPGTGKTYVAQALAEHLAGSEERVTLVQFHPSYAYEDFVRGFSSEGIKGIRGWTTRIRIEGRAAAAGRRTGRGRAE